MSLPKAGVHYPGNLAAANRPVFTRDLLPALADAATCPIEPGHAELAAVLLADFIACALGARGVPSYEYFAADGVAGNAALLSLRGSARDLDDLDWTTSMHPGSVIWPIALALGAAVGAGGETMCRAAVSGYRSAATVAQALGPEHRKGWHVTATAGAFGATSAACVLLGHSANDHAGALALAAANTGGIGQAPLERSGAASFNRAAATTLGLQAARAASAGVPWTRDPLGGERGLLHLMGGGQEVEGAEFRIHEGIVTASLRVLPVNGFAQSAVLAAARLRLKLSGSLESMRIQVAPAAARMTDGSMGGPWWDLRLSALRAWTAGDPFTVEDLGRCDGTTGMHAHQRGR